MKSTPRRVVKSSNARNTARAINTAHSPKKWFNRALFLLDPRHFKENWLSKEGSVRVAKLAGVGFVIILAVFLWFGKDLPNPNKINAKLGGQTTKFYDRKGETVLYEVYGDKNRSLITFDQMPENVKHATIAIEDKDFYKHGAFSVFGIGRAFTGVILRTNRGGGSTITQQYVKNALLTDQRTLSRKIKELILAIEIEQRYSKNDILKLYLNEIPYGSQAYGIETASKTYFNKPAKQLTLDEAAMLAAMPQAPSYYSPYGPNTDALIARKNLVLKRMEQQGYITATQRDEAIKTDTLAKVQPRQSRMAGVIAPHFVLYAQDQLSEKYGELKVTEGGLKVITTLDLDKQKAAEESVAAGMKNVRALGGSNAALTSADPKTGQILAMVGSYDFSDPNYGAVNVATSKRQPGSSFKPFAYATLFGKNYGPGTTIYDVQTDFGGGYVPKNYSNRFYGVQSIRTALDGSLNIPAVKALYMAGIGETIKTAEKMGITTLNRGIDNYGLSLVLGSGEVKQVEMVNAYESFANGGLHYESTPILKVTDPNGKVIEDNTKPKTPSKALDPQVAYLIANTLSDNSARAYIFGTNNPLTIPGKTVAAKTGTTTDYRDAWTMGFTPNIVTGVWAGNNDNAPMTSEAANIAAPIWNSYMRKVVTTDTPFTKPNGIQTVTLDATTGRLATDKTTKKRTDIFPSWYKAPTASSSDIKIDKVSGKEATECTPPLAIDSSSAGSVWPEIPLGDPSYGRWDAGVFNGLGFHYGATTGGSGGKDDKHSCSDVKPTAGLTVTGSNGSYTFKATATSGTFAATKIEIKLDGQIIGTKDINGNDSYTLVYNVTEPGSHKVQATVIDAGYYSDDSPSETVTGGTGVSASATRTSINNVKFTWSNDGSSSYTIKYNGSIVYTGVWQSPKTISVGAGPRSWSISSTNSGVIDSGTI